MKLRVRPAGDAVGKERAVELTAALPLFEVSLDGKARSGHAVRVGPGLWSLIDPTGRQIEVSVANGGDGRVRARVGPTEIVFELLDELTARARAAGAGAGRRQTNEVVAPIPGRVLRVSVASGDRVTAGQQLLVLEAMKMENEVKAPRDATVSGVEAEAGRAVSAGDVLVRFTAEI